MKKIAFMLSLMLCMASNIYAITEAELVGKWKSNVQKTEASPEMPMAIEATDEMKIQSDMTVDYTSSAAMYLSLDEGVHVDVYMKLKFVGKVAVDGDKIIITPDASTLKVEFTEDDLRVRGISDPDMTNKVCSEIYKQMQPLTSELAASASDVFEYTDAYLLNKGKTLTCKQDGQEITFKKK